ncbi:hypothetical protein JYU34_006786, partial [Plutella xylostella]
MKGLNDNGGSPVLTCNHLVKAVFRKCVQLAGNERRRLIVAVADYLNRGTRT